MNMARVSIAALCVSIAICAVDCVLLRLALFQRESLVSIRGVIFMMNVLALGLYRILLRRRQAQPFLVGFVVTGVLATLVYFDLCQWYYQSMLRTQNWIVAPFRMEVDHLNFVWILRLGVGGRITARTTLISIDPLPCRRFQADTGRLAGYNDGMARRPSLKHGIKRGRICAWPVGVGTPDEVADVVTYTGNPKHKTYPTSAGPPAWRSDSAKCDKFPDETWPRLAVALRRGIRAGFVSDFRGKFPIRAWVWINDVLHEARLTNAETGDYHGFPIDDPNQYPEPVEQLEAAPRVQVPVA